MRYKKSLLEKPFDELTDDELKTIGKHFLNHPNSIKPVHRLHKCVNCKNLMWYDCLGRDLWECLKNPCNDLVTESYKLMNNRQITHGRYCEDYVFDNEIKYDTNFLY